MCGHTGLLLWTGAGEKQFLGMLRALLLLGQWITPLSLSREPATQNWALELEGQGLNLSSAPVSCSSPASSGAGEELEELLLSSVSPLSLYACLYEWAPWEQAEKEGQQAGMFCLTAIYAYGDREAGRLLHL